MSRFALVSWHISPRRVVLAVITIMMGFSAPRLGAQSSDSANALGRRRLQPLPALGSAPETGFQFGATMLGVWEHPTAEQRRPASVLLYALRSTKAQTKIGVETEYWTRGDAQRWADTLIWQQFPLPYYGTGDRAPASAKEIFTPRSVVAGLSAQPRVARSWYVTLGVHHQHQTLSFDTIGVLRNRTALGTAGGDITEVVGGVMHDTRDNVFAPYHGQWIQATYASSARGAWSDYQYGRVRLDARSYTAVRGTHVLAAHLQITGITGNAPFDQLALVGNGDILRGYERGRYRDRWVSAAQGEYRSPFAHRVGAVLFAGAGIAAPSLRAMNDRVLLPTYGGGLRFQIDAQQRTNVRADYGRGRGGAAGLYIGFNQAF